MSEQYFIDTSELEPPEPFIKAKQILMALEQGDHLSMKHRRIPFPLFELCDNLGIRYTIKKNTEIDYQIDFIKD